MSEQGTGGVRENRAVIFAEGRIPAWRKKTFVLMVFEGKREACVFADRRLDRWREFPRFYFAIYFIRTPS